MTDDISNILFGSKPECNFCCEVGHNQQTCPLKLAQCIAEVKERVAHAIPSGNIFSLPEGLQSVEEVKRHCEESNSAINKGISFPLYDGSQQRQSKAKAHQSIQYKRITSSHTFTCTCNLSVVSSVFHPELLKKCHFYVVFSKSKSKSSNTWSIAKNEKNNLSHDIWCNSVPTITSTRQMDRIGLTSTIKERSSSFEPASFNDFVGHSGYTLPKDSRWYRCQERRQS
jgi:hypothetical protein